MANGQIELGFPNVMYSPVLYKKKKLREIVSQCSWQFELYTHTAGII